MASRAQPDGGKPTAKSGIARGTGGKGSPGSKGRKPGAGRTSGKPPGAPRKLPSLPMIVVWVVAVVSLAAIVYFSGSSRKLPRQHEPAPSRNAAQTPKPAPVQQSEKPLADPGKTAHAVPDHPAPAAPPSKELLALNKPAPEVPGPKPPIAPFHARAAIVIDDFGPDKAIAGEFVSLPFPITVSVMPFQAHSTEIAAMAHSHGREVILHLPMEPVGYPKVDPGPGALLLSMSDEAIKRGIGSALDASPHFRGVNNHMGSKMTGDARAMKIVLGELNRRGLFFLDSYTSAASKAWSIARDMKMPSLKRDIFLDNEVSEQSVRAQVSRFIRIAGSKGTAIAIGHPHETTLKELRSAADEFEKQGIKIVPASELIEKK